MAVVMRLALLVAALLTCSHAARILAVLPFPGKSHHILWSTLVKVLTDGGHHVVEYSPFVPNKPSPNYTHVEVHTSLEDSVDKWTFEDFKRMTEADSPRIGVGFNAVWEMTYKVCEETFRHEKIKKLLASDEHFDLVITEASFGQESMLVFGHKFRSPTVIFQGFGAWYAIHRGAGNALSIATIPDGTSLVATDQMTFIERLFNAISTTIILIMFYSRQLPLHDGLIRKYCTGLVPPPPPLVDMFTNVSLYLVNTHPAIDYIQPYTPNIVPIGGITTSSDRIVLPQNIQKFMDEAKHGVIYFSLGTVVPAYTFPIEILNIFVKVFKKLPQKVLWKIQLDSIPGVSENVLLSKWVPQPGVLGHPNCKLFMTHGGMFSQQEALEAGVPTIAIPFFGDQQYNVKLSEHRGFGLKLDFDILSEETLSRALDTVLNNPKYKENALRMSRIYKDQPMSPAAKALFWIDYVIRHRGAHHLRPVAADLPWYQLNLVDVITVIVTAIVALLATAYLTLRCLFYLVCGQQKQTGVPQVKKKN